MWRVYLIAGAAALVVAGGVYLWAYASGKASCQTKKLKATVEAQKDHDKLEAKIMRLPDPDLDQRLDRWMRD